MGARSGRGSVGARSPRLPPARSATSASFGVVGVVGVVGDVGESGRVGTVADVGSVVTVGNGVVAPAGIVAFVFDGAFGRRTAEVGVCVFPACGAMWELGVCGDVVRPGSCTPRCDITCALVRWTGPGSAPAAANPPNRTALIAAATTLTRSRSDARVRRVAVACEIRNRIGRGRQGTTSVEHRGEPRARRGRGRQRNFESQRARSCARPRRARRRGQPVFRREGLRCRVAVGTS